MQLALYNTRKWREENPKLFKAVYAALEEAMEIINADKRAAAELYVRIENSQLPVDFVHEIVSKPEIVFTPPQQRTDRQLVVSGKGVPVMVAMGGRRSHKKKKRNQG